MLFDFKFLRLRVERFRGMRDLVVFDLDASVVLLHGPNGTGIDQLLRCNSMVVLGIDRSPASASTSQEHRAHSQCLQNSEESTR